METSTASVVASARKSAQCSSQPWGAGAGASAHAVRRQRPRLCAGVPGHNAHRSHGEQALVQTFDCQQMLHFCAEIIVMPFCIL